MQRQAERFGTRVEMDIVTGVDLTRRPFKVVTYGGEYETQARSSPAVPRRALAFRARRKLSGRGCHLRHL
jgi:hypothetical protein